MIHGVLIAMLVSPGFALFANQSRPGPRCQTTGDDEITITCTCATRPLSGPNDKRDLKIALNRARVSLKTNDANDMHMEMTFTNVGGAPISDALTVYLAIDDDAANNYVRRVLPTVDFRKLMPGKPLSFSETIRVAAFPPGRYTIQLWIPDPDPALKFNPAHNFLLRGAGVAKRATGLNVIARFTVD
jgi:hypothetical protein